MSLYKPDVVTVWVIQAASVADIGPLLQFTYDKDGDPQASPFARAYRLGWYDEDFAELHTGGTARALLLRAADTCRTLDEQALPRLPEGEWNALYLLFGQAGQAWRHPENRPPMPQHVVDVEKAKFKLIDSFHVLLRG